MGVFDQCHAPAALLPGEDPVQEAGWAPRPIWTGEENLVPTGIPFPDRPVRSESLYRLSYPSPYLAVLIRLNVPWNMQNALFFTGYPAGARPAWLLCDETRWKSVYVRLVGRLLATHSSNRERAPPTPDKAFSVPNKKIKTSFPIKTFHRTLLPLHLTRRIMIRSVLPGMWRTCGTMHTCSNISGNGLLTATQTHYTAKRQRSKRTDWNLICVKN